MIIVKIIGGLGNQMFQYAYAKALENKGYNVKIDISAFETYKLHGGYQLDKYNIDLISSTQVENNKFYKNNLFSKLLKRIGIDFSQKIKEENLLYNDKLLNIEDNKYIDGYFQCEKYFEDISISIKKSFTIKDNISTYTKYIKKEILDAKTTVSIHIRRGDYISDKNSNKVHGTCDLNYYKNAINTINNKLKNVKYFVFSDDISWVKDNLIIPNTIYLDSKEKRIPHEDIYLMSLCSHNIIANSSFSWWGAWLNQNNDKIIIAPTRWFSDEKMLKQSKDIVPLNWIKQ